MSPNGVRIEDLVEIALQGGREVLDVYGTDFAAGTKDDASPVTLADLRCEAVVTRALESRFPAVPVIAEEAACAGTLPQTCDRFFLVDPLDGTKEFVSRNGDFTVNIALVEEGGPVAGVVYAPALGCLWVGLRGVGAFEADVVDGVVTALRAIAVRTAPGGVTAVGSRSHGSAETERWLRRYDVDRFVSRGSSLKFCLLACGTADLYPRLGRTMEWDTAAGDAILRAAGGIVTTLDGRPLRYGKRRQPGETDFANPWFVAFGDGALVRAALREPLDA